MKIFPITNREANQLSHALGRFGCILIAATSVTACNGTSPQNPPASAAEPSKPAPAEPAPAPAPAAPTPSTAPEPQAQRHRQEVVAPTPKAPARPPASPPTPSAAGSAQPTAATKTETTISPAPTAPCGEKGQLDCPLQAWMRHNLEKAMDAEDLGQLAVGFTRVAGFVPTPAWNSGEQGWQNIANSGAAAAKRGDLEGASQTCKTCHRAFRNKYKQSFRPQALPQFGLNLSSRGRDVPMFVRVHRQSPGTGSSRRCADVR